MSENRSVAPPDLAAALRRARGASRAFDALPASHRRELVRYIDDAKSPKARSRRIHRVVSDAVGLPPPAARRKASAARRPMWTCPMCGHAFVNRNQLHSCGRYDLADTFRGKPPEVRALFDRFRQMVQALGPVKMQAYRDKVAFMVRVRFAGAFPRTRSLDVGFWLTRRIEHPRFTRIETLDPDTHIYRVRITKPEQLDAELAAWLAESYRIGRQEHLLKG